MALTGHYLDSSREYRAYANGKGNSVKSLNSCIRRIGAIDIEDGAIYNHGYNESINS